ncbi:amidase [Methylobacterium planeticum]|uniref:Amidase n=1 Tax=Methylobacterium planeticum TaxID=2615211 RepID=A0A6N6MRI1_9HYPH|nr:amidase [Methylobacterium planeticum]KAB1073748.1 amidase [Methylobacterium planeticum]
MLHHLGLVAALRAFRCGETTPDAYLTACLDAARARDPGLRAFTHLASTLRAGTGPFGGIPVGIKDIIATADMPTASGSAAFADHVPAADAWVVARLRTLGASILGKTVTTEFAWRHPGPTHNPWRQGHTPGGSSSGSAAAVAAGLVPLALGSQTFGSVIRPAAFCGVVGLKPSFGAIPRVGVHPLAGSLDHVGLFTRSVADAAYALSWLAARDDGDRHGRPLPPFTVDPEAGLEPLPAPRLALLRGALWDEAETEQRDLVEAAVRRFRAAGGRVEELVLPEAFEALPRAARTILAAEAGATFAPLVARFPDRTSPVLKDLVREGAALSAIPYVDALRLQSALRAQLGPVLDGFDAILTLPASGPAPEGLAFTGDPAFCVPWTCLGVPAITLPASETPDGLPLGIQLVAPYRADLRLLRTALWCEAALSRPQRFPHNRV